MTNIRIKLDSKKLEKDLKKQFDKVIREENKKSEIQRIVSNRGDGNNMKLLNDIEKELLSIILECEHKDFTYSGSIEQFPQYITIQIKRSNQNLWMKREISSSPFVQRIRQNAPYCAVAPSATPRSQKEMQGEA
jgi:hypothetical protein